MKTYEEMKETLGKSRTDLSYFTRDFYQTFISEYREAVENVINGVESKEYAKTKSGDFYNKNSAAYCEFLECFYSTDNLKRFKIECTADEYGYLYPYVWGYHYAENEDIMRKIAVAEIKPPRKIVGVIEDI